MRPREEKDTRRMVGMIHKMKNSCRLLCLHLLCWRFFVRIKVAWYTLAQGNSLTKPQRKPAVMTIREVACICAMRPGRQPVERD